MRESPTLIKDHSILSKLNPARSDLFVSNNKTKIEWSAHGHTWQATPFAMKRNSNCRVCSGRAVQAGVNDLTTTHPNLATQWSDKNDMSPKEISHGHSSLVWWKCASGHEWQAKPNSRSRGDGCPVCSNKGLVRGLNDYPTVCPELRQYYADTNPPFDDHYGLNIVRTWVCTNGHEFYRTVERMLKSTACKQCEGGLQNMPVATEWNDYRDIRGFAPYSSQKADWTCPEGHEYAARISDRTAKQTGCPVCMKIFQTSQGERDLANYVESLGYNVSRNDRTVIPPLELDVWLLDERLAIEYNGTYWHNKPLAIQRDMRKQELCAKQNIKLLVITDTDWVQPGAKDFIREWIFENALR